MGQRRGYFAKGLAVRSRYKEVGAFWGRNNCWVALRSVLNNTRVLIALTITIRMGLTQSAIFVLVTDLSNITYAVPNLLSSGSMSIGARYVGERDYDRARRVFSCERLFAVVCAAIFAINIGFYEVGGDDGDNVLASYTSEAERDSMRRQAQEVWPIVVAYQIPHALVAVYGPLVVATQSFSFWGKTVAVCFCLIYLPLVLAASATGSLLCVFAANLAYDSVHFAALYYWVHMVMEKKYSASEFVGVAVADGYDGDGGSADSGSGSSSSSSSSSSSGGSGGGGCSGGGGGGGGGGGSGSMLATNEVVPDVGVEEQEGAGSNEGVVAKFNGAPPDSRVV
jgi:uncharacterized membrane protein YgcG